MGPYAGIKTCIQGSQLISDLHSVEKEGFWLFTSRVSPGRGLVNSFFRIELTGECLQTDTALRHDGGLLVLTVFFRSVNWFFLAM